MIVFPNAKINLGLNVVEKRPDGFHNLETVFYPVPLCDGLEITESAGSQACQLSTSGLAVDTVSDSDNIVLKAFQLLAAEFTLPPTAFHLHKKIPFGAGLGGGSADGAFAIRLINDFYKLNLSRKEMEEYAARLGSDCPFFIRNKPVYAEGRGEKMYSLDLDLSDYYLMLVKPDFSINTKHAFQGITPRKSETALTDICQQSVTKWKENMKNDFEKSIFPLYPELKKIKDQLYNVGALYAAMSGSGSTLFGIFNQQPEIAPFVDKYFVWSGKLG